MIMSYSVHYSLKHSTEIQKSELDSESIRGYTRKYDEEKFQLQAAIDKLFVRQIVTSFQEKTTLKQLSNVMFW